MKTYLDSDRFRCVCVFTWVTKHYGSALGNTLNIRPFNHLLLKLIESIEQGKLYRKALGELPVPKAADSIGMGPMVRIAYSFSFFFFSSSFFFLLLAYSFSFFRSDLFSKTVR